MTASPVWPIYSFLGKSVVGSVAIIRHVSIEGYNQMTFALPTLRPSDSGKVAMHISFDLKIVNSEFTRHDLWDINVGYIA